MNKIPFSNDYPCYLQTHNGDVVYMLLSDHKIAVADTSEGFPAVKYRDYFPDPHQFADPQDHVGVIPATGVDFMNAMLKARQAVTFAINLSAVQVEEIESKQRLEFRKEAIEHMVDEFHENRERL